MQLMCDYGNFNWNEDKRNCSLQNNLEKNEVKFGNIQSLICNVEHSTYVSALDEYQSGIVLVVQRMTKG